MVKIKYIFIIIFTLITLISFPQSLTRSVICITGNSSLENKGLLSYSFGEVVIGSTASSISPYNNLTQGFQQPSVINIINTEILSINAVEVFPNPVQTELTVLYNTQTSEILHVELFSGSGVLHLKKAYNISESGSIRINMGRYSLGLYVLHVYSDNKQLDRVFKIEKM